MIAGGRKLEVDLTAIDFAVWLQVMAIFREHYGDKLFLTETPSRVQPMQAIANYLGRAVRVYRELSGPGPVKRDTADESGSAMG